MKHVLIMFLFFLIIINQINMIYLNNIQNNIKNLDNFSPYLEIQNQMFQFLNNLRKIQNNQNKIYIIENNPSKKIKINGIYNLKQKIGSYIQLLNSFIQRKKREINEIENKLKISNEKVYDIEEKLKLLHINYEKIIANSQIKSKELSEIKNKEIGIINELENIKINFELENKKFMKSIISSNLYNKLTSLNNKDINNKLEDKAINPFKEFNEKLKNLYNKLNLRRDNIGKLIKIQKISAMEKETLQHYQNTFKNSIFNTKVFSIIYENIRENLLNFKNEIENKLINIKKIQDILKLTKKSIILISEKMKLESSINLNKNKRLELFDNIKKLEDENQSLANQKSILKNRYLKNTIKTNINFQNKKKTISDLGNHLKSFKINKNNIFQNEIMVSFNK